MILRKDFNFVKLFLLISLLSCCQGQAYEKKDCFDEFDGSYLEQLAVIDRLETDAESCKASCLTADVRCKSVQYDKTNQICSLSLETKDTKPEYYKKNHYFVYWQKRAECDLDCHLKPHENAILIGLDNKVLTRLSMLECLEACLLWDQFRCRSVDYGIKSRMCYLSIETRYTKPSRFKVDNLDTWHFERKCSTYSCFQTFDNKFLNYESMSWDYQPSEEACLESCIHETLHRCVAVLYNKFSRLCHLLDRTKEETSANFVTDTNFVYLEMKKVCRTRCTLEKFVGKYLEGSFIKKVFAYSDLECLEFCFKNEAGCRSVQRNSKTHECFLNLETKVTKPSKYKSSIFYTYWQLDCGCFDEFRQMFLQGLNNKEISATTPELCKSACLTAKFRCKSAEFNTRTNQCFLSRETRYSRPSNYKQNPNYYYWNRLPKCDPKCFMEEFKDSYLVLHNTRHLFEMEILKCQEACYFAKTFVCRSVEYNHLTKECLLSVETKDTKPKEFKKLTGVTHWQRVCNIKYPCFSTVSNRYMDDLGYVFIAKSESDCIRNCFDRGVLCRSASYNTNNKECRLSKMTKDSHSNSYMQDQFFNYFEKNINCRPDCYFKRFENYSFTGSQQLSKKTSNELDCIKACIDLKPLGSCKSARRSTKTGICVLHLENRLTRPSKFKKVKGIVYWELTCGDKCFEEKPFKYLDGYESIKIPNSNEQICKDVCLRSPATCLSVSYNQLTKICSISTESFATKPNALKSDTNWIYMERKEVCQPKCYMDEHKGYYLKGFNTKTVSVKNEYECKQICFTDMDKKCLSAEYHKTTSNCFLSIENHLTKPKAYTMHKDYVYWNKKCGKDFPCFNKHIDFSLENHFYTILHGKTEETCSQACFMSYCRSATYDFTSGDCYLSRTTKAMYPKSFKRTPNYVYLEKKDICKPNCKVLTFSGKTLIGYDVKQVKATSNADCIRACMTYKGNCRSVERNIKTNICNLHIETKSTKPTSFKPNLLYIYWELQCNLCFIEFDNRKSVVEVADQVLTLTSEECRSMCLQKKNCGAIQWNKQNGECYFWSENSHQIVLNKEYSFWRVDPSCKTDCYLAKYENRYLSGLNTKSLVANSDLMCAELCLNHKEDCNSAEYNKRLGKCILSTLTKNVKPTAFTVSTSYTYWEKRCGEDSIKEYPCFTTFMNTFLTGFNTKTLSNQTPESCINECLTADFRCLSAEYSLREKKCYLSTENMDSQPEKISSSSSYIYFHRKIECSSKCLLKEYPKKVLIGHNIDISTAKSKLDCIEKCLTDSRCNSVEYDYKTSTCYLQAETRKTKPVNFEDSKVYSYWELVCQDPCYFEEYKDKTLWNNNKKQIQLTTSLMCKSACLAEKTFNCRSAQYNRYTRICYLSEENSQTKPNNFMNDLAFDYYEKTCGSGSNYCFKKSENLQLNHLTKFYEGISIDLCIQRCLTLHNIHCRSITFHKPSSTCYLSEESKITKFNQISNHKEYTYYHRLNVCKPNCKVLYRKNKYLVGFDIYSYKTPDESTCVRQCLMKGTDKCRSVEWNKDTFICYQQRETKDTRPQKFVNSPKYNYYQIKC